jgi:predicted Zn-dependent peptidase
MKIEETIRADGLHIVTGKAPLKKVHMRIISKRGSADDPPAKKGLFHFFEHLAFKGTENQNTEELRAFAKRNVLDHNASTGRLQVTYYGNAVLRKFPQLAKFICDIYFNSAYPAEEIKREKEVMLNEIARDKDQDTYAAYFAFWEALWQRNPMRTFGVGTPEGIHNVTRQDILLASQKWHTAQNTRIIVVGNMRHNDVVEELTRLIPEGSTAIPESPRTWDDEYAKLPQKSRILLERPKREKAIILLGCKVPLYTDERTTCIAKILLHLLAAGDTSVLWNEIREKRGAAYVVSGNMQRYYPLACYFSTYIEMLPSRIDEVHALANTLLLQPLRSAQAFMDIQEWLYDHCSLGYENPEDYAELIDTVIKKNKSPKTCERFFSRQQKIIQSITLNEVESLRAEWFKPENFVSVIVKPT